MPELNEALSEREIEVLELVSEGATTKEIAPKLFISPNTVKVHLRNINRKLGAQSRTEAVRIAVERGIISIGPGTNGNGNGTHQVDGPPETGETAQPEVAVETTSPEPVPVPEPEAEPAPQPVVEQSTNNRLFITGSLVLLTALIVIIGYLVLFRTAPNVIETEPPAQFENQQIEDTRWFTNPPLGQPIADQLAVSIGTAIYAIGGQAGDGTVLSDVLVYSTQEKRWETEQEKPTPVYGAAGTVLEGLIYVLGGNNAAGEPTAIAEVYIPSEEQWGQIDPLPEALANGLAVTEGGNIFHFGGQGGDGIVASTYIFDPSNNLWRPSTPLPEARAGAAGGVLDDKIYVIGGFDETGSPTSDCFIFLPESETWESCPSTGAARANAGAAVVSDELYLIGGTSNSTNGEQFDPETGDWAVFRQPMVDSGNPNWFGVAVASVERNIYALGGVLGDTTVAETYFYSPQPYVIFIPSAGNPDQ